MLCVDARAEDGPSPTSLPALRGGFGASLGFVHPVGAAVVHVDGSETDVLSAGVGLDLRGGVQLTEWLAFDLNAMAETIIVSGDVRVAALIEIAPVDVFAIAAGGGVGTLYMFNFLFPNIDASFAVGLLRAEGRLPNRDASGSISAFTFGGDVSLGRALGGDAAAGTLTVGGRAIFGLLWR